MHHYYDQEENISERWMRKIRYSEKEKIIQRDHNWWLRVSFYVEQNKPLKKRTEKKRKKRRTRRQKKDHRREVHEVHEVCPHEHQDEQRYSLHL